MAKYLYYILLLLTSISLYSQSGMRFSDFERKIEPYFDFDLIQDLKKQLPQGTDYSIWGWDVGDFSGDGYNDCALSLKIRNEKRKVVYVYMFVDIDGYLQQVGLQEYDYFELPLETGVVIKQNACFITKKRKQNDWLIRSYTFDNGVLIHLDDYTSQSEGKINEESYINFSTLKNSLKYTTNNGVTRFETSYLTIPSYARGRQVYKGYNDLLNVNDVDYAIKGAYYWKGDDDASYKVKSAHDNDFLYFSIYVKDDKVVTDACETCATDYIEIWFDTNPIPANGNRHLEISDGKIIFRENTEYGLYCFKIHPGDFLEKKPYVKEIISAEALDYSQKAQIKNIKVSSQLSDGGYVVKFKIPFEVIGYDKCPIQKDEIFELGCSILLHDIDNEYRPEEETILATSVFEPSNPSTYGSLILIPNNKWYGFASNIYEEDIINTLNSLGF